MISGHLCREEFMRRAQYFEFDVRPPFFYGDAAREIEKAVLKISP